MVFAPDVSKISPMLGFDSALIGSLLGARIFFFRAVFATNGPAIAMKTGREPRMLELNGQVIQEEH